MRALFCVLFLTACSSSPSTEGAHDLGGNMIDSAMPHSADLSSLSTDLAMSSGNPYATQGTVPYTKTTATASVSGHDVTITIYLPSSTGTHPAVFLSPGFVQPAAGYLPYADRLASFGIITLLRDDPGFSTDSTTAGAELATLVGTWLPAENAKASGPLAAKVDLTKVGLMGHSRGGQASLLAATGTLKGKVVAFFGLDPVDTSAGGNTARDALPNVGIPTVFMGETLDGDAGGFGMACAPSADNYQVLYAAAPSPSMLLTVVGAAHFDFEVQAQAFGASFCKDGPAYAAQVLDMAVTISTGFFARELLGAPVGAGLDGAGVATYVQAGALARSQK